MRIHVHFDQWTALLLATLGCTSITGCGGRETSDAEAGGASGAGGSGGGDTTDGGAGTGGSGGRGGGIVTGGGPPPPPVPGRPFLVDGTARRASACPNDDWLTAGLTLRTEHRDEARRLRLSHAWAQTALLEHGSIAAFARFTLQLLALGAPASFVEAANAAIADETKHAKLAFAVASAYGGRPTGPGTLAIEGALDAASLRDVVVSTIREGCIGETVSAILAVEALPYVSDPVLHQVLTTIADDETRHAQLAWRFVQWALERGDADVRSAARAEFERAAEQRASSSYRPLDAEDVDLLAGGIIPDQLGQLLRAECMRRVIGPCADALFRDPARVDFATAPDAHA
jgi:hypothetical protein